MNRRVHGQNRFRLTKSFFDATSIRLESLDQRVVKLSVHLRVFRGVNKQRIFEYHYMFAEQILEHCDRFTLGFGAFLPTFVRKKCLKQAFVFCYTNELT